MRNSDQLPLPHSSMPEDFSHECAGSMSPVVPPVRVGLPEPDGGQHFSDSNDQKDQGENGNPVGNGDGGEHAPRLAIHAHLEPPVARESLDLES